jgi:flagellar biosynthesis protein FlhA
MEQIIINALKEKNTTGISLDPTFTKNMLKAIAQAYETASAKGDNSILLTSPIIRKDLANLIRQNIEDLHVLAFTELPETRRINIIATIENKIQEEKNK